ncbi:MAG: hypothetical protein OEX97_01110 [Acidimicrobiia bacterium]|nr:hypothetical protein [Acidimicrobiia bacterium]
MRGIHRKRFRGRIATIERPDLELDVELWVEERGLTIARKDKPLGTWPIEAVDIDRVGSSRFVITLDGEHSAFIARDPIAFSYEGLKAITSAKEKAKRRYSIRLSRRKPSSPSLQAILVARVQGLAQPHEAGPPIEDPRPIEQSPRSEDRPPAPIEVSPPVQEPVSRYESRDPFDQVPEEATLEPEPAAKLAVAPGIRRHPGVLERVRNARNGVVHEHAYSAQSVTGGLVRRVCNECGHVSIDISE